MADPAVSKEVEIANSEARKLTEQVQSLKIRTPADLESATKTLVEVKRIAKNIEVRRRTITQPLNLAIKEVNDLFKAPAASLKEAESAIKAAVLLYHERAQEKAAKRTEKINREVDEGKIDAAKGLEKLGNIPTAPTSVSAGEGSSQVKVTKRIRIVNPGALPADYFLRERVIEALRIEVEADVRAGKELPAGAESYEDRQVAVRT